MTETEYFTSDEKNTLLALAREAIKCKLTNTELHKFDSVPEKFQKQQASFVTLRSPNGQLRGCIGNIEPFETLIESVPHNARNAAMHDPRFASVDSIAELDSLRIEISVLTPPEEVESYKDIVIGKHGIILRMNNRGAVFLPQVATEQGWSRDSTLSHLSLKAGLPANAWKDEKCKFKVFEAIYFSE
jgi:AmmeMemoRadiSam system protein A